MVTSDERCGPIAPGIECNRPPGHAGYHSEYTDPAVIAALDSQWALFHPDEPLPNS